MGWRGPLSPRSAWAPHRARASNSPAQTTSNGTSARVTSILRRATTTKPVRRALLWRNAGASDPQLVAAFTADWSAEGVACQPGLLVLLDFPAKPAGPIEPAPQCKQALAASDADGWWKPVPGELAR